MKIFNEDLEKHLLCDDLSFESYGRLCFIFTIVGIYVTGTIDGLLTKQFMNHYPSNSIFLSLITFFLSNLLLNFLLNKIYSSLHKKTKCQFPQSNPIQY